MDVFRPANASKSSFQEKKQKTSLSKHFLLANIQLRQLELKKCHTLRLQYLHLSIPTKKFGGEESMGEDSKPFWVPSSTKPKRRKMRGGRSRSSIASAFDLQLRCWGEEKHVPRYACTRAYVYIYIHYTFHVCIYEYILYACRQIHLEHL